MVQGDLGFENKFQDLLVRGREILERTCRGSSDWDDERFRHVLILCGATDSYISAPYRPESIDLGRLNKYARELLGESDKEDFEYGQPFFGDLEKRVFIAGKVSKGELKKHLMDWTKQAGREARQKRSLSIHVHPRKFSERRICPFSGLDFKTFVEDPEQVAKIVVMGDYLIMLLKTSVTPHFPSKKSIEDLTCGIAEEYMVDQGEGLVWKNVREAIRANKEICLAWGLVHYLGKIGEPLKRVPLT